LRAGQRVDQEVPVRATPAVAQIVTTYTRKGGNGAAGDIVEIGIAVPLIQRINGGVDEAGCGNAVGRRLLIGQSEIACPHGGGKTGPAVCIGSTALLVGANVERKICVGRDVWHIPISFGTVPSLGVT